MSKAKKIISMLLVVMMILTVAPVSVLASAADPAYTYGDVSFSKTEFSVSTEGTTDVIRIAANAGSFSVPASGQEGVIVSATPSGIPSNSGTYNAVGYAGETPSPAKIVFSITGQKPDAVPTVVATNISGFTAAAQTPVESGDTITYTWNITGGSALKGANVVFTITYMLKGVPYKAFAYSHVEHILVMNGWLGHLSREDDWTTDANWRHAVAFQLQSKNMYSGMNSGTPTKTLGYINYASEGALDGGALKGFGNQDNVDGSVDAYASAVPNTAIPGEEVGAFIKFRTQQKGGRYNGCFADDGNRSESLVYIDRRNEDLRSLNMRATIQAGETDKFSSIWLQEMTFHNYAHTFGSGDYDFTSTASTAEFAAVNYTSGNTGNNTLTKPSTATDLFKQYIMVPITGTGPATSTTADTPYSITADLYTNDTFVAASMNVDFRIYDSTVLWNVYNGIVNGKALDGTSTYTTPSDWSAAPNFTCVFDKGAHLQESQFTGGWEAFKAALDTAGCLLQTPDVTQTELDNAAVNLYVAYTGLTGYNATVNWQVNHYLEGTTTPIIPTQTVDPVAPVYGQAQPAGSVWVAKAATIEGFILTSADSQNMTISGNNATESFTFYYKPREYNFIVETNTGADASIALTPTGQKIYESSIETGTLDYHTFDGWYYDDGTWSQPVFSDSLSDEGGRYILMPGQQTTIFGKWVTTPIDIQYIPIADGVELPVVNRGEQAKYPEGQTTTQFARPADLDVDGYLFVNFFADKELTTPVSFPLTFTLGVTTTPYTIYARMVDVNGKISFESNGGTAVNDITFTPNQTVNAPTAPTKKGYTFAGWYDQSLTTEYTFPRTMPDNTGFIAYAKWEPNEYTISFDLQADPDSKFDTQGIPSIHGFADQPITEMPITPKKFGYIFHHWELDGVRYELVNYPTENITLTPYWVETDYSAFIDVTAYEKLSGNYVETDTAEAGDVITFRMTSETNFYTGSSLFVFMYDKNFYELVNTGNAAFKLNNGSEYISGINATHIGVTTDSSLPWPEELASVHNGYNAMMVAIDPQVTSSNYMTAPMADSEWIVEFQLRIKDDATGSGKVYMDNAWTRTPDNIMGTMFYGWSKDSTEVYNTFNNVVTPDLELAEAVVSVEQATTPDTQVKLLAGDGAYADSTKEKTYTGRAETEILDYEAPTREGYDLVGWTKTADSTTVDWTDEFYYPAADTVGTVVEYTANWKAKMYPVTFYTDDTLATVFYKLEYAYDSDVTGPPVAPSKQGYVFKAWVNADTGAEVTLPYVCKGEASFYPVYDPSPNTAYTIKINYFNNQAGTEASTTRGMTGTTGYTVVIDNTAGSAANTIYLTPADLPTLTGYEFDTANNTLPITGVIAADGSLILEVRYKAAMIDVTLDANGGTFADGATTAIITGEFQSSIMESHLPAAPTREGYNFIGYQGLTFTDGVATRKYTPNLTFKAQWEAIKYTMTFDAGTGAYADGTTTKTAEVALNGAITAPEVPTLEGWSFIGWSLNGGDATTSLGKLDAAEARTYVAVFEKTPYNVNYYVDGALDSTRSEVKYIGDAVTIADAPTKYGYTFSGWTINGAAAADFTMGAADVDIYGDFTAKTLDVTFDANGGYFDGDTSVTTKAVATTFNTTITPPATAPVRAGYEFLGWAASAEDAASKTTVTSWPTLQTEEAVTYYAVWNATIWDYTVKFYYQDTNGQYGAEASDETITLQGQVASVVNYDAAQTKDGFTLDTANSTLSGTVSVETPLVLEVKYARNQHTLTIDIDGQKTTSEVYYGAAVAVPADPTKVGYSFDGWNGYTAGMTMPDEDLTITAIFTAKQFTVTYYTDNTKSEVAYTRTAAYGSDYTVPTPTKVGHDFAGWMNADGTASGLNPTDITQIPLNGAEYYATWTVLDFNVVYRANGGSWADGNTKTFATAYGTAQADWQKPADPERAGYTFNGWNMANAPATMPAEPVNILANWTQETYTVIFKDSLTDEVYSEENYVYNDMVVIPDVSKEGHEFLGWTDADGNEVEPMDIMADIGANGASVTYTAKWDAIEYTITFVDTGDVAYEAITQDFGTAIAPVADPVKTGYTFDGWDTEIPATMPAEDLTITAQWKVNQYTITFVDTGDVAYEAITKDYKAPIGTVADPVKTGYTFNGWDVAIPAIMPAENLTITAKWTINTYDVIYMVDGVEYQRTEDVAYGAEVTAIADPTKEGYTFSGWDKTEFTMPASDVIVSGTFTVNTYDIIYMVDGVEYERTEDVAFGTPVTAITAPTKEGYTFSGWDKTEFTMPASDVTVSGTFTVNTYDVIYMVDGVEYERVEDVAFGTPVTVLAPLTKTGYTFSGWDKTDFTMPAAEVVINGTWTANSYTVTWVDGINSTEDKVETYIYKNEIVAPADPVKAGYTFLGWQDADGNTYAAGATMPAANVVYTAQWKANDDVAYTVKTFLMNSDGTTYAETSETLYGTADKTATAATPEKEGFTFNADKSTITGTIAGDGSLVLEVYYDRNKVTVDVNGDKDEYFYDDVIEEPETPVDPNGGTFEGWEDEDGDPVDFPYNVPDEEDGQITITPVYHYTVVYISDNAEVFTITDRADTVYTVPAASKIGYTFAGWTLNGADAGLTVGGNATIPVGGATYVATWTGNEGILYTVKTFVMNNDGATYAETSEEFTGTAGETATAATPDKEGFTFNAEKSTITGTIAGDGSLVLEVYYDRNKVTVDINGEEDEYFYDDKIEEPETPVDPNGGTFEGWEDEDGDPVDFPYNVPDEEDGEITIKPVYHYTVVYKADGKEVLTVKDRAGTALEAPEAPAKGGYKFIAWIDADGKTPANYGTMPEANIEFNAVYETGSYMVNYWVNGVIVADKSAEYGEVIVTGVDEDAKKVNLLTYKTPDGYEFDGWYTDAGMTTKLADGATVGAAEVNLYAKETAGTYDAIFIVDGEVYATVSTVFEKAIDLPAEPTKEGFTFNGWTPDATIMDAEGMTFIATWVETDGAFTATYYVDGELYGEYAMALGDEFEAPADPYKKGYEFMGWATKADAVTADVVELPATMPAKDVVYYAVFEIRTATVNFYVNKALDESPYKSDELEAYVTADVMIGELVEMPADPTNIDAKYYTFIGWTDVEGGTEVVYTAESSIEMVADGINLYAVYERVAVKLMPKAGSTTVIERTLNERASNVVKESYNDDSVRTDFYAPETEACFEQYYIYGLKLGLRDTVLETTYVDVQGDGYITVTPVQRGRLGTGTLVEVFDNVTGERVEYFYVVIFGDLDGNARLTTADGTILADECASPVWSTTKSKINYMVKAANLDGNRRITVADSTILNDAVSGSKTIEQKTGLAD